MNYSFGSEVPDLTIVLLHGRNSSGEEFASQLAEMAAGNDCNIFDSFPEVRWVFPSAEPRMSSVFKEEMTEWFDTPSLYDITQDQHLQIAGLKSSIEFIQGVVEDEIKRVGSASKVVLGGISQGQATALHVLLCGKHKLGAFVGSSGWLPFADKLQGRDFGSIKEVSSFLREMLGLEAQGDVGDCVEETPVLLGHGSDDEKVDVQLGRQARDVLMNKVGMKDVSWKEYQGAEEYGHWLKVPEQLDDVIDFLKRKIKF